MSTDTTQLQAALAVKHLLSVHFVGPWSLTSSEKDTLWERVHPFTAVVYARVRQIDEEGIVITVWDRTVPNSTAFFRDASWVDMRSAMSAVDHMLKVQGVLFLADLMG